MIDADERARELGYKNGREMMLHLARNQRMAWQGEVDDELEPVSALVDFGRWMAVCECGGAQYVSESWPYFFCLVCSNGGKKARRVIFPANIGEIEQALEAREVQEPQNVQSKTMRAMMSRPKLPGLSRSWNPGQSIADLRDELAQAKDKDKDKHG